MLKDIVDAKPLGEYRLYLRFEDGIEGSIDLAPILSFRNHSHIRPAVNQRR